MDGAVVYRAGQPPAELPDTGLVASARAGDREAFSRLAERYRDLVFACAFAHVRHRDEAEDLAQEALARAFAALPGLRGNAAFQPWLMGILRNLCRDALRRRRVRRTEPLDAAWLEGGDSPEALVLDRQRRRDLAAAIAGLPELLRVPLVMHFVSRCTYREIALALGVPETTVVGRTSRAVRVLRERFKEVEL
jgi:RNA polymerase sigma-70 factor (ECF subfamily)